jgi:hypothetical protein
MAKGTSPMSLDEYRDLARWITRPSAKQCEAFSRFVAGAHSWYKHLPVQQPGSRFFVFVDLFAGYDAVELPGGRTHLVPRDKKGFHYTAIPTRDYRARYGHLAYMHSGATRVSEVTEEGLVSPSDHLHVIMDREGRWRLLPEELLVAGTFHLTGLVHLYGWQALWEDTVLPPESGGREAVLQARERVLQLRKDPACAEPFPDDHTAPQVERDAAHWNDRVLYDLLEPERQRQRDGLLLAIRSMLEIVYYPRERPEIDEL